MGRWLSGRRQRTLNPSCVSTIVGSNPTRPINTKRVCGRAAEGTRLLTGRGKPPSWVQILPGPFNFVDVASDVAYHFGKFETEKEMPHSDAKWKTVEGNEIPVAEMTSAHLVNACCMLCRKGSKLLIEDSCEAVVGTSKAAEMASHFAEAESYDLLRLSDNPLHCWHRAVKEQPIGRAMLVELRRRGEPFEYRFWSQWNNKSLPRWKDNFYPEWTLDGDWQLLSRIKG